MYSGIKLSMHFKARKFVTEPMEFSTNYLDICQNLLLEYKAQVHVATASHY